MDPVHNSLGFTYAYSRYIRYCWSVFVIFEFSSSVIIGAIVHYCFFIVKFLNTKVKLRAKKNSRRTGNVIIGSCNEFTCDPDTHHETEEPR